MTINTFLHLLCIISLAVGAITLVLTILNKKISIFRKINSSIYLVILCAYIYISEFLLTYLKNLHVSTYTYNEIFTIILNVIALISIVVVAIGTNSKKDTFEKYIYKTVELAIFVFSAVLTWNLFYSNKKNVFLFPLLLICFVLSETFLINSTEKLNTKSSVVFYFIANAIFSGFWIAETYILCSSIRFSSQLLLVFLIVAIISLSSIILGILNAKKEFKK